MTYVAYYDKTYVDLISNVIINKREKYCYIDDKSVKWDLCKYEIQTHIIDYSIKKQRSGWNSK